MVKPRFVLDAWAVLALLQGEEPAASRVRALLADAQEGRVELFISIINLGEVIYRIGKTKGEREAWETLEQIRRLPLVVVPASEEAVLAAARFKMLLAISYADAFAAATTDQLDAMLVTGDPELTQIGDHIRIEKLVRG
jgi:predicted nucleic acid-binding protein